MPDRTACYEDLEQPQKRGQATEAIVQSAFAVRDVPVLVPTYDTEPYDLVVEVGGRLHRIQCKTAYRKNEGAVAFETVSTRRRGSGSDRTEYDGCAEYFAVYDPINDDEYLVPVSDAATETMALRFRTPKTEQRAGINWCEEYLLDDRLDDLRRP
ncbi:group I intron-associated PD-(D/E)XK endonuclease [Halosolutus gelatinilyticus]|uniref:group I intron-associated PD-(D/E)XK endonuclease n=1 Tax=Halosolutus gelatinilyticus TaxID=2931975 RepID=UPI001FF12BBC|nr:group I intron-associated PD-(D/E)XK endonuclease [Halosolutus gelatinilyticus]